MAGEFRQWATRLRLAWNGVVGQAILGSFATVIGDKGVDWAHQANYEHMPTKAADPASLPLIGSGRLLDKGPSESNADYAARLITWIEQWARAGTPLGLLLALHYAGFDDAVLVQQNGLAYSLTLPLNADPTTNLVITSLGTLGPPMHSNVNLAVSAPSGYPWWTFDSDVEWCSRFAVLFPGPPPSPFTTFGVATFTGTEDGSVSNPWPLVTWNNPFADTTYRIQVGAVTITGGGGPVVVAADNTTKTTTGVRIASSASFVGTVDVLAWQDGANPFADLHPQDLARLQSTIKTWRPAKAKCMGVFAVVQGRTWGWPKTTWSAVGQKWGPSTVVAFPGA